MPRELEAKIPIAATKEASPLTKIIKTNPKKISEIDVVTMPTIISLKRPVFA